MFLLFKKENISVLIIFLFKQPKSKYMNDGGHHAKLVGHHFYYVTCFVSSVLFNQLHLYMQIEDSGNTNEIN